MIADGWRDLRARKTAKSPSPPPPSASSSSRSRFKIASQKRRDLDAKLLEAIDSVSRYFATLDFSLFLSSVTGSREPGTSVTDTLLVGPRPSQLQVTGTSVPGCREHVSAPSVFAGCSAVSAVSGASALQLFSSVVGSREPATVVTVSSSSEPSVSAHKPDITPVRQPCASVQSKALRCSTLTARVPVLYGSREPGCHPSVRPRASPLFSAVCCSAMGVPVTGSRVLARAAVPPFPRGLPHSGSRIPGAGLAGSRFPGASPMGASRLPGPRLPAPCRVPGPGRCFSEPRSSTLGLAGASGCGAPRPSGPGRVMDLSTAPGSQRPGCQASVPRLSAPVPSKRVTFAVPLHTCPLSASLQMDSSLQEASSPKAESFVRPPPPYSGVRLSARRALGARCDTECPFRSP